jgi:predicted TIM-barrel fold metal-dependent hydrolase
MPEDLTPPGRVAWRDGMRRLADRPNVVSKLSGLGTFVDRNDPKHVADIVAETAALFGPNRCLFGSNFPIEKLWTSYGDLVAAFREAVGRFPESAQRAMLAGTAATVYRL